MTEDDDNEEEAQKERIQAAKMAVEKRAKKEKLDKMKAKRLARKDDTSFASMEDDEDDVEDDVDEDDDNDDDDDDGESFKGVQRQQEELVDDDSFISFDRRAVESVKSTSAYVVPEYIRRADRGGVIPFFYATYRYSCTARPRAGWLALSRLMCGMWETTSC